MVAACVLARGAAGSAHAAASSEFAGHHRRLIRVVAVDGLTTLLLAPSLLAARLLGERLGPVAFGAVGLLVLGTIAETLGLAGLAVFALVDLDAASSSPDHLRGALHGGVDGLAHVAANRIPLANSPCRSRAACADPR
jgi:hypothetical protein